MCPITTIYAIRFVPPHFFASLAKYITPLISSRPASSLSLMSLNEIRAATV